MCTRTVHDETLLVLLVHTHSQIQDHKINERQKTTTQKIIIEQNNVRKQQTLCNAILNVD